ncbi:hypothetical protein CHS0354_041241 [Potamilus streckersoni]|uniref:RING-type domain-containing protein n=1 Tax=Potamilus streckersoni TaxID=2493646 RepID=A0AAE0SF61_9BIVA|nr:hypothetical protein CHS0354_041241 [Potamilus streckersoni]
MAEGGEISFGSETSTESSSSSTTDNADMGSADTGMDRFLQRARTDTLFELRRLQHGDKPVTGQNHRENIGEFLHKQLEARANAEATGKENVPLNSPNVEEHRPEAIVIEIQGLSQQQRVSSILQTAQFRRHLENIIRGSLPTTRSINQHTVRVSTPPVPPPVADTLRVSQDENIEINQQSQSSSSSLQGNDTVFANVESISGTLVEERPVVPRPADDRNQEQIVNWNDITEIQHENLVQEISELVHRRLVTSSLDSEFRQNLELHVQHRVHSTQADGSRVQEFVRSIPQSQPHIRNDFSNLGLPVSNQFGDNWDNISVTSISAAAVPYTQTNLYMSREIHSLKAQLEEMKNMMKVSFDLQLDIQRAIRQEVAAAMTQALASGGLNSAATSHQPVHSTPVNDTHCLICLDNFSDSVLYQCGHMCVCYTCGRNLMDRNSTCPVCRAPIRDIIRAYKSNDI